MTGGIFKTIKSLGMQVLQFLMNAMTMERVVVLCFYAAHVWIGSNKHYLVLLVLVLAWLLAITRDAKKSVWIVLLASLPFHQAKHFNSIFMTGADHAISVPIYYFISYTDVLLISLLLIILLNKKSYQSFNIHITDVLLIPIVVLAGISTYFAGLFSIALFGYIQLLKLFLLYLTARIMIRDSNMRKLTYEIFILFILCNSVLIIVQYLHKGPIGIAAEKLNTWSLFGRYSDESRSFYRPGGITDDPNAAATVLGMFIPALLTFSLISKEVINKYFALVTLSSAIVALIFTGSRAAWGTVLAVSVVSMVTLRRYYHISVPYIISKYWVVLGLITIVLTGPILFHRLQTIPEAMSMYGSGTYRIRHGQIALNYMVLYPLGIGLNTTAYELAQKYEPSYYIFDPSELHNIWAQISMGIGPMGVLGFIAWLLFILLRFAKMLRTRDNIVWSLVTIFTLVSYVAISSFYPWLLIVPISGFFWILAAGIL